MSEIWGDDGTRDHPSHDDEADALSTTGAESCEEIAWAIGMLKVAITWRKGDLRPEDAQNEIGRGHRKRIEILEKHLHHLEVVYAVKCRSEGEQCDAK
jgi:hypothetical protein